MAASLWSDISQAISRGIMKRLRISPRRERLSFWPFRRDLRMPISGRCSRSDELVRNYTFISDDPKDEVDHFDLIQLIANDQSHTPSGKKYDRACEVYFVQRHAKSMDACTGSVPSPDTSPFDVLVRVAAGGRVEKILSRPKTKISECLVAAMKDDTFPIPPEPDYWWHLHMIIAPKRKTSTSL